MAVDRTQGQQRSGWVYIAWTELVASGNTDIYVIRSTTSGTTWDPPVRVNQVATNEQWSAWLACDPLDGKLTAIWYDHRADPTRAAAFTGVSTDGGSTWQDFQLGDESFLPGQITTSFMGDYIAIDASEGYVVPVWADRRDGQHVVGYTSPYLLDWSGTKALAKDFLIPPGYTLDVLPGTTVQAAPVASPPDLGRYPSLVEVVDRGMLRINGQPANRVRCESTSGVAGSWGGILFDVPAVASAPPGYGYTHPSLVLNADIEDATEGIAIRQTGAPSLGGLSFANIQGNRHVVLDSSDVYVPYGGYWNLTAPTIVGIADSTRPGAEIGGRNPGKVDVIVHGQLNTSGAGTYVTFRPQVLPLTQTDGDEWGGIYFDWIAGPSVMSNADVGYALTPISIIGLGSVTLEDSKIHRFRDRAIWVFGSGTTITGNTIYRDDGLPSLFPLYGNVGIAVEKTLSGVVNGNTITLTGMNNDSGGSAIQVLNTKTWCQAQSITPETLQIESNTIVGPGALSPAEGKWSEFARIGAARPRQRGPSSRRIRSRAGTMRRSRSTNPPTCD